MRKFKTTLGTTAVAFAVLTTSVLGGTSVAFAGNTQSKLTGNSVEERTFGNIELTDEERQWLDDNTKTISDVSDLKEFYNESGSNYLNNVKRGGGVARSVDNTKNKYFPAIGDQGSIGSCGSWSMTYLQASYTFNKARNLDGKDTKNVMSPMWTYNMTNQGGNNGSTLVDIVYLLSEIGAVSIEDVPAYTTTYNRYQYGDLHARDGLWLKAQENKINDAFIVDLKTEEQQTPITSPDDTDLDTIKMLLDSGEILTASSYAYKWKTEKIQANSEVPGNDEHVGEQIVSRNDGYQYGGHRITIVGYDDDIWVDINKNGKVEEGEKGAFKIANSWGEDWGNDGCIWFSYDSVNPVSSVKQNSAINLSSGRAVSLMDIVAMAAAPQEDKSNTYAEVTMNSAKANTVKVDITATDAAGNKTTYGVTPFKSSNMYYSVGPCGFDGTNNATDGTFTFDLRNVVADLTPDTIKNYTWSITFTDTTNDAATLVVKDVKLLDTLNGITYASDLTENVSVNASSATVNIK